MTDHQPPVEFADYVARGRELRQSRDSDTWELGDLAADFEVKLGRPDNPDGFTLAMLANEWGVSRQRASEWRNVSAFYSTDVRTFPVSWEVYNIARRHSQNDLENALELLETAVTLHYTSARDFERFVRGILHEGVFHKNELPPRLHGILPDGKLWVTIKRATND